MENAKDNRSVVHLSSITNPLIVPLIVYEFLKNITHVNIWLFENMAINEIDIPNNGTTVWIV